MGCDIYLHTEIKLNNRWYHYSYPRPHRNYKLFVRDTSVQPIAAPRGIPDDATEVTKYHCDVLCEADGHHHSHLTAEEIRDLAEWAKEQEWYPSKEDWMLDTFGFLMGLGGFDNFARLPQYRGPIQDVRFVFWFMG